MYICKVCSCLKLVPLKLHSKHLHCLFDLNVCAAVYVQQKATKQHEFKLIVNLSACIHIHFVKLSSSRFEQLAIIRSLVMISMLFVTEEDANAHGRLLPWSSIVTLLTPKVLNFWKFTSYCSLKPLWSGMGEVVPARTSPTLHPPSPPTVHRLSRLALLELSFNNRAYKTA